MVELVFIKIALFKTGFGRFCLFLRFGVGLVFGGGNFYQHF